MTYVSGPHDPTDLLHRVQVGTEATVHSEDLLVDDGGDGQAVEAVGEGLPQLDVVATLALIVEAVDAVDGGTFVVSAENEKVLGVLYLVRKEQAYGLEGLLAAVNVVAKEQVVSLRGEAPVLEEAQQIVVLPVDVSADLERKGFKSVIGSKGARDDVEVEMERRRQRFYA